MSSILLEGSSTDPLFEVDDTDGGLRIVGQADEPNTFDIGESGEFGGANVDDTVVGGLQGDQINTSAGGDIIFGQAGDDNLDGGEGNDIIIAGDGDDVIQGRSGFDILVGGDGIDTFEFFGEDFASGEVDQVADFNVGDDFITIEGVDSVEYNPETGVVSIDGQDAIVVDEGTEISTVQTGDDDFLLF